MSRTSCLAWPAAAGLDARRARGRWGCGLDSLEAAVHRRAAGTASGRKTFGPAIKRGPIQNLQAGVGAKSRNRLRGQVQRGQPLWREPVAHALQQRIPPAVTQFVAQQLAHIHGLRFQLQRRQALRRNHVANVGEDRAIPGQIEQISFQACRRQPAWRSAAREAAAPARSGRQS